jgi:carbohydrate diacid regulator
MTDEQGIIIASTDASRIDTFHEGAFQIISKGMDELIIYDDHTYTGSRKGVNLPLMLEGKVTGVISITGEYEDIAKFGQIAKRITEILLLENHLEEQKKIDTRIMDRFLVDWIFSDMETYPKELIERGEKLGIDISLPRRVIAAEIAQFQKYQDRPEGQVLIDNVNRSVRKILNLHKNSIFLKTTSRMIGLIPDCDNGFAGQFAEKLNNSVFQEHNVNLHIGIDKRGLLPNKAIAKAYKALNACKSVSKDIIFYENINIEIFADEISPQSKKEFIDKVFLGLDKRETGEMIELLKIYFDMNASLKKTSEKLFMHKNTVQYKLNKLSDMTGRDPRILADAALFYIALHFYEDLF